ncbi:envelope glycoprotein L [Cervid alphaherpesvirus 2]|uniref:Envelope glycoprotein L n=1 Tax=Cervid alphaherpesvirus 2 TaxID=365327 RepID=A0A455JNZ4_9ALPH|nr:envelope glycoprotein L [Cervid alphaherpesvirus 2]AVT50780.1 envelope glycoprotein L [Cervid alphaherpesvirus 2]
MALVPARARAWALLAALLWLSRASASGVAEAILASECGAASPIDSLRSQGPVAQGLLGVFLRGRCSPPEALLWYDDSDSPSWANPYVAARGLAEDIRRMLAGTPVYRDLAAQALESAFGLPHEVRAPLPPPPLGCIQPPRYHAPGPCHPGGNGR